MSRRSIKNGVVTGVYGDWVFIHADDSSMHYLTKTEIDRPLRFGDNVELSYQVSSGRWHAVAVERTPKISFVVFRWSEFSEEAARELCQALRTFNLYVYHDPNYTGTDAYGFLISDEELTPTQIRELTKLD